MATQEDFLKDVHRNMDVLRRNFPDLLSSLDQQQQVRHLINDRKSKAFLCALVALAGEEPEGYAEPGEGGKNLPDQATLLNHANSAIRALEPARSPSLPSVPLSRTLTPARSDGPGAHTAGGPSPAQSQVPGSRRRSDTDMGAEDEAEDALRNAAPAQPEDEEAFFSAKLKDGTKFVEHLLPFGKEAKEDWRDAIPLGKAAADILKTHLSKLGSKLVYKTDHGLSIGDTQIILDAVPFPTSDEGMDAKEFKTMVNTEIEVEPDREFASKNFKVPEAQRSKNKELFSSQKIARAELFKLALPLAEQTDRIRALTECNGSAGDLIDAMKQAFPPPEGEDEGFEQLTAEQQKDEIVRRAFQLLNKEATLASQRAFLGAQILLSKDAELQLQRFAHVQPQEANVKKSAFGRTPEGQYRPKGNLAKDEMATNQFEELSIGIAAALQHRGQSGKKRQFSGSQGARQRSEKKFKKPVPKNDANSTGLAASGYQGKHWLPPEQRGNKAPPSDASGFDSRAALAAKKGGAGKAPAGRQ